MPKKTSPKTKFPRYNASAVEAKWQKRWEEANLFEVNLSQAKKPYYTHVMFPYPSGDKLHVGHWYNYGAADTFARFKRMQGYSVFSPMGFDAFGLPAENYAIETGTPPRDSTRKNVETMIQQLMRIGCMYDWTKSVNTSEPAYYRWTQWLFLQMYKHGLAYRKEAVVNHCPKCQTVLANEQVWEGRCERCSTAVVQKPLEQWFWKITDYADRLLEGLEELDWPPKTKLMQLNWIGRKEGINITYEVEGANEKIVCFTTRPDTNFGATFIVLAPEHAFVQRIVRGELRSTHRGEVEKYVNAAMHKTELERQTEGRAKTGAFTGYSAINNLNGAKMPVWVSDFVLGGFGTGAVVGVPGHDRRDFEFAKEFGLRVIRVVVGPDGDSSTIERIEQVQEEEGTMVNSEFLNGLNIHVATQKVMDHLEEQGWGERITTYRIRDWLVSRQRYWGAPIPIVYDQEGNPHPIPEEHLPWLLPTDVEFKPTGKSPLFYSKELRARTEKLFGKGWTPEFDTMDTFVDSSFYSLMYLSTENSGVNCQGSIANCPLIDPKVEQRWLPVSCYIGGAEHACMHLIYARFVSMALKDFGFIEHQEQYKKLVHQGVITNHGVKMSKSRGNVVSPDGFIERYGSDVFRMYLMFMGPFTEGGDWSDTGISGVSRFVQRIWKFFSNPEAISGKRLAASGEGNLESLLHRTIKKVTEDIEKMHFNTAISALMEFLNALEEEGECSKETAEIFAKLLAPLAPHLAEELWERLLLEEGARDGRGEASSGRFVINQPWPAYDPSKIQSDTVTIVIQVNGKVRGEISVPASASMQDVIAKAKEHINVQKFLEGKKVKKEVYVEGKLVSLVISSEASPP
jgi:leucyl-tRNA synthetase